MRSIIASFVFLAALAPASSSFAAEIRQTCQLSGPLMLVAVAPKIAQQKPVCDEWFQVTRKGDSRILRLEFRRPAQRRNVERKLRRKIARGKVLVHGVKYGSKIVVNNVDLRIAREFRPLQSLPTCGAENMQPGLDVSGGAEYQAAANPMGVPQLSSKPGAKATIYLDFDGATVAAGDGDGHESAPFNAEGSATTFSAAEITAIQNTWKSVSEKYAPFDVNITTVPPDALVNGVSMRVVITSSTWGGNIGGTSGVGYFGSFWSFGGRTSWAFSAMLANSWRYISDCIAHEAGHAFGLSHQTEYTSAGVYVREYYQGNENTAPIMGSSYYTTRPSWWNGVSPINGPNPQDDIALLINPSLNNFDYAADDRSNNIASAMPLTFSGTTVSGNGIIERTSDVDIFRFKTAGGATTLNLLMAASSLGQMLDARMRLLSSNGTALGSYIDNGIGTETYSGTLATGTYYLEVSSHGNYSDLGQYVISGTVVPASGDSASPTISIVTPADSSVVFSNTPIVVSASDDTGVIAVRLLVDNVEFGTLNSAPYTFSVPFINLNNGPHSITAIAFDDYGKSASASILITSQARTPTPTPTSTRTPTVTATRTPTGTPTRTPTPSATAIATSPPEGIVAPIASPLPSATFTPLPTEVPAQNPIETSPQPTATPLSTPAIIATSVPTPKPIKPAITIKRKAYGGKIHLSLAVSDASAALRRVELTIDSKRVILRKSPFRRSWLLSGNVDTVKVKVVDINGVSTSYLQKIKK